MTNIFYYSGPFTASNSQTYKHNGVTLHKPPFGDDFWSSSAHQLGHEFMDLANAGRITDRFYGSCNDFNDAFLGKAARGCRFMVIAHGRDVLDRPITQALTHVGTRIGTLAQQPDGSWFPVEYEPLRKISGKYFLYNFRYASALRDGEISGDEAVIIQKSLTLGEEMVWQVIGG